MPKLLQRQKPAPKWYPFALIGLIVLVHLLDTYATDVVTKVQSLYVNEFFVRGQGLSFETGLQRATLISTMGYAFALIGPFYKALMDKIGRRPIFIINTAGMALGMLLCWYAPNFYLFAAGQLMIVFFTMHDMQMIYVYEASPAKWRSTLYFACKFLGVFGTLAIPLLRDAFVQANGTGWRNLFWLPALVGGAIFLLALLFMRESDVFIQSRLEPKKPEEKDKKSGIVPALKYIFSHRQLKWLSGVPNLVKPQRERNIYNNALHI